MLRRMLKRLRIGGCLALLVCHAAAKITNSDFSDAKVVQNLAEAWIHTEACQALTRRLESAPLAPIEPRPKLWWSLNLLQLRALIARTALNSIRDPAAYALRWPHVAKIARLTARVSVLPMLYLFAHIND